MNKIQSHVCPASKWQWKTGVTQYFWYLKEAAKEENPIRKEMLLETAKDCAAWNRKLDDLTRKHYEQFPPKSKTHDKREKNLHKQSEAYCIPCQETSWLKQVYV